MLVLVCNFGLLTLRRRGTAERFLLFDPRDVPNVRALADWAESDRQVVFFQHYPRSSVWTLERV
jgi:hypothetical protein